MLKICTAMIFANLVGALSAFAKDKPIKIAREAKVKVNAGAVNAAPDAQVNKKLQNLLATYRRGEMQKRMAWESLARFTEKLNELTTDNRMAYEQVRSELLFLAGYPVLASEHALRALSLSNKPFDISHNALWDILWKTSKAKPIQYLLEELGSRLNRFEGEPPAFGNNWYYVVGNAYAARNKEADAQRAYAKVTMQDRYFLSSQYQLGLIAIKQKKVDAAEAYFRSILNPSASDAAELRRTEINEMQNYAHMALGRLYYQQQRFVESAKEYRQVRRSSNLFYEAIFEQSWALFLAGSVKHALGSLYSAHSPYFKDRFNPESKVLESLIYYWVCRYDDARTALAEFADENRDAVANLGNFLDRQNLSPDAAYQLFENLVTGVSGESIGIPIQVLNTAARSDVMLLARDQFATVIEELNALDTYGIYGSRTDTEPYRKLLLARAQVLRGEIGNKFLGELQSLKVHFDELYDQSQFLYLELLMSQKDQILGKELHADSKMAKVTDKDAVTSWSRKTQSWEDNKFEYWWDEIGFHIIDIEPECKI